jgi:hypothetical protein
VTADEEVSDGNVDPSLRFRMTNESGVRSGRIIPNPENDEKQPQMLRYAQHDSAEEKVDAGVLPPIRTLRLTIYPGTHNQLQKPRSTPTAGHPGGW